MYVVKHTQVTGTVAVGGGAERPTPWIDANSPALSFRRAKGRN
jgi:hypothetical protein